MKKLIVVILLSENGVLLYSGSPLMDNPNTEYTNYLNKLTKRYPIILSRHAYDALREKAPPFPCRKVAIVSTKKVAIENGVTNTTVLSTIEKAIKLFAAEEKIVVIADNNLATRCIEDRYENIDTILEIRFPFPQEISKRNPLFKIQTDVNWNRDEKELCQKKVALLRYRPIVH